MNEQKNQQKNQRTNTQTNKQITNKQTISGWFDLFCSEKNVDHNITIYQTIRAKMGDNATYSLSFLNLRPLLVSCSIKNQSVENAGVAFVKGAKAKN